MVRVEALYAEVTFAYILLRSGGKSSYAYMLRTMHGGEWTPQDKSHHSILKFSERLQCHLGDLNEKKRKVIDD